MVHFCSCVQQQQQCENSEIGIVQFENESHSNNSNSSSLNLHNNHHQKYIKMFGPGSSRCFGSLLPVRPSRSFKNQCFLTAILTFCVGIGIGVLIPLYLMPKAESLAIGNSLLSSSSSSSHVNNVRTPNEVYDYVSSVLSRSQASATVPTSSVFANGELTNSDSDRFPEFAQIQALVHHDSDHINVRTKVTPPSYSVPTLLRPKPNVKFIDSRILSLHPVQQPEQGRHESSRRTIETNTKTKAAKETVKFNESSEFVDGIYWSDKVERQLPKGFTNENVSLWRNLVFHSAVERMEEGCGRMQNRLLTLDGEVHACCRYRQNSDQIQGEIFSFYLSRLLGLENLAPSALALIQLSDPKWIRVRPEVSAAQWSDEKPVVLTQFIPTLSPAFIPPPLRDSKRSLHPVDIALLSNSIDTSATSSASAAFDVKELAQWSDLIVFDYLTANLDRMVNNLYNLQWNPSMMDAPAHNLVKDTSTGLLVFLDNESGLLHGYRLLDKYEQYHRSMLESVCIFRKSTVNAIKRLKRDKNVGHLLRDMFHSSEPHLVDHLPMMPDKSIKILNHRIERVFDQISKCESLYQLQL